MSTIRSAACSTLSTRKPFHAVLDLMLDAANIATNDRSAFPHCLSDGQAEAFADRLLEYDRGPALQGVYQRRILDREDGESAFAAVAE